MSQNHSSAVRQCHNPSACPHVRVRPEDWFFSAQEVVLSPIIFKLLLYRIDQAKSTCSEISRGLVRVKGHLVGGCQSLFGAVIGGGVRARGPGWTKDGEAQPRN